MSAVGRRKLRAELSLLLLLCGILFAVSTDRGTSQFGVAETSATLFDEAQFSIQFGRGRLRINGATVSAEHEAALLRLIDEQFRTAHTQTAFKSAIGVTQEWDTLTTRLLYLVAATDSANALLDSNGIVIRGTTLDAAKFENRLAFLRAVVSEENAIVADVLAIDSSPFDALCRRTFDSLNTQAIRFRQSSTSIRRSSYPMLDRLAEFAFNCRNKNIFVGGHGDATGNEAWNLQISRQRAQAVADHLIRSGVKSERLLIEGFGSSLPVADNDTIQGREQNRRVEIELR